MLRAKANHSLCLMPLSSIPQIQSDCPTGRKFSRRGDIFMITLSSFLWVTITLSFYSLITMFTARHIYLLSTVHLQSRLLNPAHHCTSHVSEQCLQMLVNENQNTENLKPCLGMCCSNTQKTIFQSGWYSTVAITSTLSHRTAYICRLQ